MALSGGAVDARPLAADYVLVAYLLATGLLAAATLTPTGAALAAGHAAGAGAVLWLGGRSLPENRLLRFLRILLPVVVTPILYTELQTLNQLVTPGYYDPTVEGWESALFGVQLSVEAARAAPWTWLSELLHLGYFSYYLVLPAAAVGAFLASGDDGLERYAVTVAAAFYVCYLCFAVFPVTGPRYLFPPPSGPPAEGPLYALVHAVLEAGSSKGTAFPSSHVAAALAALLAVRRETKGWFRVLLPFVALLVVGTVYGRFHYGVDALAGLAVGVLAWLATPSLVRRLARPGRPRPTG